MTPAPDPTENRVYLSASNHFYLALKTFGYSLVGYLLLALVVLVVVFVGAFIAELSR